MVKILFLADTHLGFDLPTRPRVLRRRRGPDFFDCFERALQPALRGEVDAVVHGGDLFFRSRVPPALVDRVFKPLKRVARSGVPVYLVPGNHERSAIPHDALARDPNLHLFDRPRTFLSRAGGLTLALSGFPCVRRGIRDFFRDRVEATGWRESAGDLRLLCIHQTVEGATVGAHDHTFGSGTEVIRGSDIPGGFAAILSGHIHRHQVLTADLRGRPLRTPVFYPGSTERTSFAERNEPKGYLILAALPDGTGGRLEGWSFEELPARPMVQFDIRGEGLTGGELRQAMRDRLDRAPENAVVRIRIHGILCEDAVSMISAESIRTLTPPRMNVEARWVDSPWIRQHGENRPDSGEP